MGTEREHRRTPDFWFPAQTTITARDGQGQGQELGTRFRSPIQAAGPPLFAQIPVASQGLHQEAAGVRNGSQDSNAGTLKCALANLKYLTKDPGRHVGILLKNEHSSS